MFYLALGDSISIDVYTGVVDGGAVSQFARLISATEVQDLTRDGNTTDDVVRSLDRIAIKPDVVTLTAGGNDLLMQAVSGAPDRVAPSDRTAEYAGDDTLRNLRQIAERLAALNCPVIINTVYDPTDGDDALAALLGVPPERRVRFDEVNNHIRGLATEFGFQLSDLEILFHGHGINSTDQWIVMEIEPNYAGATAIATHWRGLLDARLSG
jgi:lysophospholipase L1-like esterase